MPSSATSPTHATSTLAAPGTDWPRVALLIGIGIACAVQIGKVPPAIPALREALGLSIVQAAWVISMLSAIAALTGFIAGTVAGAVGAFRATVASLLVAGTASLVGAWAQGAALLLATRFFEGAGFLVAVVAIPSLLAANSAPRDRQMVSGLWGTYMGTGMALALGLAPAVLHHAGWRGLWAASGALMYACAAALAVARPQAPPAGGGRLHLRRAAAAVMQREPALLAAVFACYAYQYLAVFGFLPTVLHEAGLNGGEAGALTAVAVLANAAGNLTGGWAMKRGWRAWQLFTAASFIVAVGELGIYSGSLPVAWRVASAIAFSFAGGWVPSAIFVRLRLAVTDPVAAPIVMGTVVQASHVGQLAAPVLLAWLAARVGGWQLSPLMLWPAAVVVVLAALALRPVERRTQPA